MSDSESDYEGEQQELDLSNVSAGACACMLRTFSSATDAKFVVWTADDARGLLQAAACACNLEQKLLEASSTDVSVDLQSDVVTKYKAAADIANSEQPSKRHALSHACMHTSMIHVAWVLMNEALQSSSAA